MTQNTINNTASILAVDNLTLDGNTIISTDTNGNIVIAPDGTGDIVTGTTGTDNVVSMLRSAEGQWLGMNDQTDAFGVYNSTGTPEGGITANIGSICTDTTNGVFYIKQTDSANTGWTTVGGGTGTIIQTVIATSTTAASTTTKIAADATIPQNTEGAEHITVTITPTDTANILIITWKMQGGLSGQDNYTTALFQDTTAGALYANGVSNIGTSGNLRTIYGRHTMTAGTTSSTTFKIRFGPQTATAYVNRDAGNNPLYGGVSITTFVVQETLP